MFANFIEYGSFLSIFCAEYASVMAVRIANDVRKDPYLMHTPGLIRHPLFTIVVILAIPLSIWQAVYVGLFDGFWAGVLAWLILQVGGSLVMSFALSIIPAFAGRYALLALLIIPAIAIAYVLSIHSSLSWLGYLS
ncbi:hypothetical protein GKQ23_21315 [Erwinia sp. E602]|uniref:hypothetical protein n=1 Tax=Erwinia sp. E602 TaxID=2675378 RepID=UPI001BA454F3|nr:hypothetical protein [Erwinia sp. E602]QUG77377.1 hypothetical protein GKQ23_21315 [Erwinia sp. E602]